MRNISEDITRAVNTDLWQRINGIKPRIFPKGCFIVPLGYPDDIRSQEMRVFFLSLSILRVKSSATSINTMPWRT